MINRLLGNEMDPAESIMGLGLMPWYPTINEENCPVNIWIPGGQEIYHSTYPIMLRKGSVYLILVQARIDEPTLRLTKWLEIIKMYAPDSPVILIQSKADIRIVDLDIEALKQKYGFIRHFVTVSSKTGEGIAELQQILKETIQSLESFDQAVPVSWLNVLIELYQFSKPYISYTEFIRICEKYRVYGKENLANLLRFLHRQANVLYFEEEGLGEYVFINFKPLLDAIYSILDNKQIIQLEGLYVLDDFRRILNTSGYADIIPAFLQLLQKFDLVFRFGEEDDYLIPNLMRADAS